MDLVHAVFAPAGDGPHPAILATHGWGSNALDLLSLAPYVARGRCLMLAPQGPVEVEIGAVNGYGWYQLRPGAPPDLEAMSEAADRLMKLVDAALERYPIDPRKLIVMGFSQGGVMAYNLALRHPDRFAGLVAIATWFPEELAQYAGDRAALARMPRWCCTGAPTTWCRSRRRAIRSNGCASSGCRSCTANTIVRTRSLSMRSATSRRS